DLTLEHDLSKKRFPPRMKSLAGFFGIILQRLNGASRGAALERAEEFPKRLFDLIIEALGIDLAGRPPRAARERVRHHIFIRNPDCLPPLGCESAPSRKELSH